jgi:1-aminocyclopropane-1-carboxylate deaminase
MPNFVKMKLLEHKIPIVEIPIESKVRLFIKREDLTHPKFRAINIGKCFIMLKNI